MATAPYHKPVPLGRSAGTVPLASGSGLNRRPAGGANGCPGATAVSVRTANAPGPFGAFSVARTADGLEADRRARPCPNGLSKFPPADNDVATHAPAFNTDGPATPSLRWLLHAFGTISPRVATRFPRTGFRSCREGHPFANRQVSATNEPGPHDPALA